MSITSDLRGYADSALEQGKQVVEQVTARANVSELTSRAGGIVTDLRTQAEKTLNIEALRSAVEPYLAQAKPYLAQAKQYRGLVAERAEGLFDTVKSDERVAKVVSTAESLTGVVVGTVNERVVAPVSSLAGRKPAGSPAAKASKPASTRPAAKKAPAKKATTARKSTASKATPGSSN
jgi:hypothetical protein